MIKEEIAEKGDSMNYKKWNNMVYEALLVALIVVCSYIHVGPYSIALDALPAFFGALWLGPRSGFRLAWWGHVIVAFISGVPLSWAVHVPVAFVMGCAADVMGRISVKYPNTWGLGMASVLAFFINVIVGLGVLYITTRTYSLLGLLWLPLSLGAAINIIGAILVYLALKQRLPNE